eukprot:5759737-Ditylum_brightwellii.AAC.1
MEEEMNDISEDNTDNSLSTDEDKSVEIVNNPHMLTEEADWEAAKIYFEKYKDAPPGSILGQ